MAASLSSNNIAEILPSKSLSKLAEMRSRVLIGQLPEDFLRVTVSVSRTNDEGAVEMQQQSSDRDFVHPNQPFSPAEHFYSFVPPHTRGRIAVKIVEAKLSKNYGLPGVRMDPYIRLRIGNTLFETQTCVNGGKAPHWNRTVNSYLPDGVESIYLQIFDERAFTDDELVAWAHVILPPGIFNQEVIDEWYQLSGQQGEGKEGVINLVISFTPIKRQEQEVQPPLSGLEMPVAQETAIFTEEELNELQEMFPSIEKEVIRQVLEAKAGNKDSTVTALIEMAN